MNWLDNIIRNGFTLKLWPFYVRMEIERADGDEEVAFHWGLLWKPSAAAWGWLSVGRNSKRKDGDQ